MDAPTETPIDNSIDNPIENSINTATTGDQLSDQSSTDQVLTDQISTDQSAKPSYVKLAMRNMVRKKSKSLSHFFLMTIGLLGFLIGISYLTR
jgi:hypothetical protein